MRDINSGKRFEADVKASVPDNVFYYRFKDGTANFTGGTNENVRFQAQNICDCLLYTGHNLYLLELKSHKGTSLPFSAIRKNQLDELSKASLHDGVIAGFLIHFADKERAFFCKVDDVMYFMSHEGRKSIPVSWCEMWGKEIKGRKLKVNYRWDLEGWINNAS